MSETPIYFLGGPLDGVEYSGRLSDEILVPDAADMVHGYDRESGKAFTLFGEHRYELRTYRNGDTCVMRYKHVAYTKPQLPSPEDTP